MGVARHPMFAQLKADYAIVDEAAQVSEPIVIGALFHAGILRLLEQKYNSLNIILKISLEIMN